MFSNNPETQTFINPHFLTFRRQSLVLDYFFLSLSKQTSYFHILCPYRTSCVSFYVFYRSKHPQKVCTQTRNILLFLKMPIKGQSLMLILKKKNPDKQSIPTMDSQTICKDSINSSFSGTYCCSPLQDLGTSKVSQSTAGWICLLFHNHYRYRTENTEGIIS